ncbi:tumor necrosis factor receptor superfamily member 21 isoform X2 [Oncorhynchus tshawytscha]|uniref:tumor necrosis factor receptor superfamily member 21 isoform X2 n=1 Tax=Oncorhynchus tshawytscha TaxID=74940 RepID=UPI000D0A8B02|nr:tumor necrosis factor receptor superfamily member 21 isoform X2 [Oncorhynchus tshawytscha]
MDYQRHITSRPLRILCLFNLVSSVLLSSCPRICDPGFIIDKCKCVPCHDGYYWYMQNGLPKCDQCSEACSVDQHLTQVKECGRDSNRECHCDSGFFCDNAAQYTCRRCKPCSPGTFSNKPNLTMSCKPHTDCGHKGMTMVTEGTATQDRVCAQTSPNSPTTTAPPTVHSSEIGFHSSTSSGVRTTRKPLIIPSPSGLVGSTSPDAFPIATIDTSADPSPALLTRPSLSQAQSEPSTSLPTRKQVTEHSSFDPNTMLTTRRNLSKVDSNTSPAESASAPLTTDDNATDTGPSPSTLPWLLLIGGLLGVVVLLVVYFVRCKERSLKSLDKWKGPVFGINAQPPQESCPYPEAQHLLGSETGGNPRQDGAGLLPPGVMKQVTVDHSGGENISNTVGSIYIYSPGTVVLGYNKSERKVDQVESGVEGCPLTRTPQQESSCPLPEGPALGPERMSTQEETCKELRYPIPATSN